MKKPAIIIDIDGTLANSDWRRDRYFPINGKKDWKGFYEASINDEPHKWCMEIIERLEPFYYVLLVTGREGTWHELTKEWLFKNKVKYWEFMGRAKGDYRKDAVVKEEIYRTQIEPTYDILFAVDDRQQVVDMWRSIGVTCLQCAKGDF